MEPSRQILWNIPDASLLDLGSLAAGTILLFGLVVRGGFWLSGRSSRNALNVRYGALNALQAMVIQNNMIRGRLYRIMHYSVFYGMLTLLAGSALAALDRHYGTHILRGTVYLALSLILDLAGMAVITGVCLAAYKRYVVRPDRLESGMGDALILMLLAAITGSGFVIRACRQAATSDPWAVWSPFSHGIGLLIGGTLQPSHIQRLHQIFWFGHAALALTLVALFPWTKLLHMVAVPLNYLLSRSWRERAAPAPGDVFEVTPPGGVLSDFTRKQLLEADACVECGRCKKLCVMHQARLAAPFTIMKNLKQALHRGNISARCTPDIIPEEALWACSGCRSCEDRCPMNGTHAARIIHVRRAQTRLGLIPPRVEAFVSERATAVVAIGPGTTVAAAAVPHVFIWPGCGRHSEGLDTILSATTQLLGQAGVAAVTLSPPACCGGSIRRLGNEARFLELARRNMDYLRALCDGATIITPCPHCFTTLTSDYAQLGGRFTVRHHSAYLAGLLQRCSFVPTHPAPGAAVFHDPCFLGRYHGEFAAPRILAGFMEETTLLEMKHSRMKGFCCGSGGGTVPEEAALKNGRELIRQARKNGAGAIITACPYCRDNLKASAQAENRSQPLVIRDIAELLAFGGTT